MLSTVIVAPFVVPESTGALIYIVQTEAARVGGLALAALGSVLAFR